MLTNIKYYNFKIEVIKSGVMHMIDIDNEINAFDLQTYKIKRYIDELGPLNTLDKDKEMEELAHE